LERYSSNSDGASPAAASSDQRFSGIAKGIAADDPRPLGGALDPMDDLPPRFRGILPHFAQFAIIIDQLQSKTI
jgi:hypothetical protein